MTYNEWEETQKISPVSPEAHYAELAWNAAKEDAITKWEYTTDNCAGNWHEARVFLNKWGAQGWEVVAADFVGRTSIFIFKRPLTT